MVCPRFRSTDAETLWLPMLQSKPLAPAPLPYENVEGGLAGDIVVLESLSTLLEAPQAPDSIE